MDPARVLSADQIGALAARLAGARWDWKTVTPPEVATALGWRVLTTGPGGGILDTGLTPVGQYAEAVNVDGAIGAVEVRLADPEVERRDVFAAAVEAVAAVLGTSTLRRPGPTPDVQWSGPAGVVQVSRGGTFVTLALLSPDFAAELAGEPDNEGDDDLDGGDW